MTVLVPRDRRRSRYLFDLSARYCLERNALDAITGQAATFSRAGLDASFASNGLLFPVGHAQPTFLWADTDGDGILEPHIYPQDTATNAALHKRDLTNASWTKTGTTAARDQVGIDGVTNSASSLTATGANGTCIQNITLASSSRAQSAYVKRITGSGTVNMTTDNGVTWTAVTVTSNWTRVKIPAQTLANPQIGFRIVTSGDKIAVDWVQNETTLMTGPIGGTADNSATETRAAATLTYPFNLLPSAMTVYAKFIELGTGLTGTSTGLLGIGASTNPALMLLNSASNTYQVLHRRGSDVNSTAAASPSSGQLIELRAILNADGSVQLGQSINGAAEVVAAASAANALAAAWFDTTLTINSRGGSIGFNAFSQVRIAAGAQSLAYMREG